MPPPIRPSALPPNYMPSIAETYAASPQEPLFICDFSPPRSALPSALAPAAAIPADWISVAYNPGRSARANSAIAAHRIQAHARKDVVFTIATRDMNRLAIQSLLLGAALLGLQNVVVVKGDDFTPRERQTLTAVNDYSPTQLIRAIADMNRGVDFRSRPLDAPTQFCIGASIDMARAVKPECALTRRKIEAGAQFFISQPAFTPETPLRFLDAYAAQYGAPPAVPIFFGVQMMAQNGVSFAQVPQWVRDDLDRGRPPGDIALQTLTEFLAAGLRTIYVLPPILSGGRRDYAAAQYALERIRAAHSRGAKSPASE